MDLLEEGLKDSSQGNPIPHLPGNYMDPRLVYHQSPDPDSDNLDSSGDFSRTSTQVANLIGLSTSVSTNSSTNSSTYPSTDPSTNSEFLSAQNIKTCSEAPDTPCRHFRFIHIPQTSSSFSIFEQYTLDFTRPYL